MLDDWGFEKKVFSITLDNASSNNNIQNFLKEHLGLSNSLLLDGEFFHIRCSAHILNVRVTESKTLLFFECVRNVGDIDTTIGLRSDRVTRWNSTFIMLQSAINYCHAFYSLSLRDSNFKCCSTSEEWRLKQCVIF